MDQSNELFLNIEGMHCASCVSSIESGLSIIDGVQNAQVNLALNSARVEYDPEIINPEKIISTISEIGYTASIGEEDILSANIKQVKSAKKDFLISFYCVLPLFIFGMIPMLFGVKIVNDLISGIIQGMFSGLVLFYAGRAILKDALLQLKHFRANMNSLIAIGTLTAYGWSLYALTTITSNRPEQLYFDSAAMIVALILLGRFFEARSKGKAGDAINALLNLTPPKALALINDVEIEIETGALKPDMILIVRPGERIPADGQIIEGKPNLDESMLTGESLPVDKKKNDMVYGGSLNGNIPFKMKVTASGDKTFLSSIIRMVSEAQANKAPVQKLADRVAAVFVPIVLGLAVLTFALWYLYDPNHPMLIKSVISILIIACPCALGLATPTAILAGTGRAAKEGIIIRGGDILEKIVNVDTVIFDKTGTLTHGELEVAEINTFGQISIRNLIRLVASAELQSEHPVAKAIVRYMQTEQIDKAVIKNVEIFPGIGLKAESDGRKLLIGNKRLMQKEKVSFGQAFIVGDKEMEKGRTVVYASLDGQVIGLIALSDKLRSEAKDVVSTLRNYVSEITMLSGDTRKTASGVASAIGIDNFEAEIKPDQKRMIVESLSKAGRKIAMIGDGINDAPALAEAEVGVAIGSGTDIAIETSDVVLVQEKLNTVIGMFDISHKTMKIIKQNLFWAFFYNILAIPLAAGLFYPAFGWSLSPMVAAAAMSFSSVFVVTNSLRLNRVELRN
jgi:Cu+-exporting ATPase